MWFFKKPVELSRKLTDSLIANTSDLITFENEKNNNVPQVRHNKYLDNTDSWLLILMILT